MTEILKAPFPWFGGKSRVAHIVWERFGDVPNYVEPFAGSLAVLLGRPTPPRLETVNDKDGYIANFWRAVKHDPDAVAYYADNPVNENDLHARHVWLVNRKIELLTRLEGDPDYYDAKVAGWWVWGISCHVGGGWCNGSGPWKSIDGKMTYVDDSATDVDIATHLDTSVAGIKRQIINLRGYGKGIHRKTLLIDDSDEDINSKKTHAISNDDWPEQCQRNLESIITYMRALADRLRLVRVTCGDWERICKPSTMTKNGITGVFLDPPYSEEANRDMDVYGANDDSTVAHRVREWCIENGNNSMLRIALCGYEGEHEELERRGWSVFKWKAHGGYSVTSAKKDSRGKINSNRERIWFSPHCLSSKQLSIW